MLSLNILRRVAGLMGKRSGNVSSTQAFMAADVPLIVQNLLGQKFVLPIEGYEVEILYRLKGSTIHLDHAVVPVELNGRGIGEILAKVCLRYFPLVKRCIKVLNINSQASFEYAVANGLAMKVHCQFLNHNVDKYKSALKKYQV